MGYKVTAEQARSDFETIYDKMCTDRIRKFYAWVEYKNALVADGLVSEAQAERWADPKGT